MSSRYGAALRKIAAVKRQSALARPELDRRDQFDRRAVGLTSAAVKEIDPAMRRMIDEAVAAKYLRNGARS